VGVCLACSIVLIAASLAIEHNRARPLLNTRWLTTGKIAKLFLSVLLFRIVLSESTGAVGFLQALGLNTDQMQNLFIVVLLGSVAGLVVSALTINPATLHRSLMFALLLIAAGALIDAHATSQRAPSTCMSASSCWPLAARISSAHHGGRHGSPSSPNRATW